MRLTVQAIQWRDCREQIAHVHEVVALQPIENGGSFLTPCHGSCPASGLLFNRHHEQPAARSGHPVNFQDLISPCIVFGPTAGVIHQPYDLEVGAGTFHPATFLRSLGLNPGVLRIRKPAAVQPMAGTGKIPTACSTLPVPGRAETCARQYSGPLSGKPQATGHRSEETRHPVCAGRLGSRRRSVPGVWGGSASRRHGDHQFTYFQEIGGIPLNPITGEITYGTERIAMYLQQVDNVYDLSGPTG